MPGIQRQTAYKIRIKDLVSGKFIRTEGWEPSYVVTDKQWRISRANVIGVIISKSAEENFIAIDDGTEKISVRSFNETILNDFNIGEIVNIIGRPREFGNEIYIMPEIIKPITDSKWVELRKKELDFLEKQQVYERVSKAEKEKKAEEKVAEYPTENIYKLIKELDNGEGADFEEVVKKSENKNTEQLITELLKRGEIFQIKPGKLKILE